MPEIKTRETVKDIKILNLFFKLCALLMMHWNWPEIRDYLFLSGRGAHPEMKYGIHSFRLSVKELRHRSFAPITTFLIKSV